MDLTAKVKEANPFVYICKAAGAWEIWFDEEPDTFEPCDDCLFWGYFWALDEMDQVWFVDEWGYEFE